MEDVERLSRILVKTGAIKFGLFKLTSGKLSPYYIDLRIIPSSPKMFEEICSLYEKHAKEIGLENFDCIASVPTSGIIFGSVLAYRLKKPFIYVRKETKKHGVKKRVEGHLIPGWKVLLVDDLITTGSTLKQAALALRAEGAEVEHALVLVDREEGGKEALSEVGVRLHAVTSISQIARYLFEKGILGEEEYRSILAQVRSHL